MKKVVLILAFLVLILGGCVVPKDDLNTAIEALPAVDEVKLADEVMVLRIRELIDASSDEEFNKITTANLERFLLIEARITELKEEVLKEEERQAIEDMFVFLPTLDNLTIYYYDVVKNIVEAYNDLDLEQQGKFDSQKRLLLFEYDAKMDDELVPEYRLIEEAAFESMTTYLDASIPLQVEENLDLPFEYVGGATSFLITWSSSSSLITDAGVVTRPDYSTKVVLTATFEGLFLEDVYTIEVMVKGMLEVDFPPLNGSKKLTFAYLRNNGYGTNLVERDYMKIDVINYSFAKIVNGELSVAGLSNLQNVLKLRAKGVRVVIVIDGVSEDTRAAFATAASSAANRDKLATSIANVIEQYQLDGVDLDWEFPTGSTQVANFSLLVKRIREKLDESDRELILSAAVISGGYSNHYDLVELNKYLDFLHIMSYGMSGRSSARHQSALIKSTYATYAINSSVNLYISGGFSREKIVFGIPFYVVAGDWTNPSAPALGQSLVNGFTVSYSTFMASHFTQQNYVEYYDANAMVYYAMSPTRFASYDNPASIHLKCEWAIDNGLAGVMFWDYGHDQAGGTLLNAIYESFSPQN